MRRACHRSRAHIPRRVWNFVAEWEVAEQQQKWNAQLIAKHTATTGIHKLIEIEHSSLVLSLYFLPSLLLTQTHTHNLFGRLFLLRRMPCQAAHTANDKQKVLWVYYGWFLSSTHAEYVCVFTVNWCLLYGWQWHMYMELQTRYYLVHYRRSIFQYFSRRRRSATRCCDNRV